MLPPEPGRWQVGAEAPHQHYPPLNSLSTMEKKMGKDWKCLHNFGLCWEPKCPFSETVFLTPIPLQSGDQTGDQSGAPLLLASSRPSCQGDAHQWDGRAGDGGEKYESRNSWLSAQWKGDVSTFPKDLQGINTVEKGN